MLNLPMMSVRRRCPTLIRFACATRFNARTTSGGSDVLTVTSFSSSGFLGLAI